MSTHATGNPFSLKCPNCQKKLKFADQRLIGKKVKCPGCKEPFLLELPEATEGRATKQATQQPKAESKPAAKPTQKAEDDSYQMEESLVNYANEQEIRDLQKELKERKKAENQSASDEEVKLELVEGEPPMGTSAVWIPDTPVLSPATPNTPPAKPASGPPSLDFSEPATKNAAPVIAPIADDTTSEVNRYRSRRKKSWGPTLIVGVFLLLGVGTVGYLVATYEPKKVAEKPEAEVIQEKLDEPVNENEPYSRERLSYRPQLVDEFEPTTGKPLDLAMMPRGVSFIVHIRPALLWSTEPADLDYQKLKASLTEDVSNWIAAKLKEVCRRDPEQIEDAYLGFILGASGSEPEICSVVHLKEPAKLSDLIDEFKGEYVYEITERPDLRLKRDDKYAYLIKDESTFAIAPRLYASELEESQTQPFVLSVPMENLLRETDQQRLLSVMGVVRDLRTHYPKLMPESTHLAMEQFLEWIGEDIEALSWSIHPEPYLHSQLAIHPTSASNPPTVNKRIQKQLAELPEALWKNVCLKMSPRELRFRNFIGRLPAMLEAFRQATISSTTANYVSMTTVLPAKAAPNLALATMFTVNEAARTDFTAEVVVVSTGHKLPETVKERLSVPVDSEFNRQPLEMALQYLAGEIEVSMFVDGDALKDAGYTKNMPQTFTLGVVPVEESFKKIVMNYQEAGKIMVMSIDEKKKSIRITTEKFAKRQNLPIYDFGK